MGRASGSKSAESRAFWRAHMDGWRDSELNQRQYCAAHGLSLKNFGTWRAQLKYEDTVAERKAPPLEAPALVVVQLGRRRRFSKEAKRQIVEESSRPGATVSGVARRYGIAASAVFRWRQALGLDSSSTKPPSSPTSPSWTRFLKQHIQDIVAIDFFAVPTARLRALVVLIVPAHDRRRASPGVAGRRRVAQLQCDRASDERMDCAAAREALVAGSVWITSSSSRNAISNGFSAVISPLTTNGARTDPWRWIHPMVDLSIHPNWARSSSSQRSMAYTTTIFGKPHEYSGPTGVAIPLIRADRGLSPWDLQPGPSPQPPRHLQAKPLRRPGRMASASGPNASDRHPLHAGSGLFDNAPEINPVSDNIPKTSSCEN